MPESTDIFFEVLTPIGFYVRVTNSYWDLIVTIKHPVMSGCEKQVKEVLFNPDEIRRSRSDTNVYLFYKQERTKRWTCAVTKKLNGVGFLITTYPTDTVKEGERIWHK
ncbi:MAG: DUF4258 domain-containing protein [SAR324 cluster bacterium]|nr:DUF4258 domain-containing protein [SAR324 cluster bacterium]